MSRQSSPSRLNEALKQIEIVRTRGDTPENVRDALATTSESVAQCIDVLEAHGHENAPRAVRTED